MPDDQRAAMDKAAHEAQLELEELEPEAVDIVAKWWAKWYMRAGHKRLGRILVAYAKASGVGPHTGGA